MRFFKLAGFVLVASALAACGAGGGAGGGGGDGGSGGRPACSAPADCPEPSGPCAVPACSAAGVCGSEDAPDGVDAKSEVAGDCKKDVCQAGSVSSTSEPLGAACTVNNGKVCDEAGNCVGCNTTMDCDAGFACEAASHTCVPINCMDAVKSGDESDVDCGGACPACGDGKSCLTAGDCASKLCAQGVCQVPTCTDSVENADETDVDCGGGSCPPCGPDKGCDTAEDCAGGDCSNGVCTPNCSDGVTNNAESDVDCGGACSPCALEEACAGVDANCEATAYCDATGQCAAKKIPGTSCSATNECIAGVCDVNDGICCDMDCSGECRSCKLPGKEGTCSNMPQGEDLENECPENMTCSSIGKCLEVNGQTCASNAECLSENCIDGFCCNTNCLGTCRSCDLPGFEGTCTEVAPGQDPYNECAGPLSCNGNGACLTADGQSCIVNGQCNSGFCVDGVCCNTACNGVCVSCNLPTFAGTCTPYTAGDDPENQCNTPNPACNGAGACGKAANGAACTNSSGCTSNNCIDGVCCNSNCNGLCQSCSAAKTGGVNGTCSGVTVGTDPDNECSGGTPNCAAANMCGP